MLPSEVYLQGATEIPLKISEKVFKVDFKKNKRKERKTLPFIVEDAVGNV